MTQESGAAGRPELRGSRMDRLLGGAADPGERRAPVDRRPEAPSAVRRAALVVALEAVLLLGGALVLLYLTVTGTPQSTTNAVAEVVLAGAFGAVVAAAAVGLWRVSPWARGPVVALQLILAALAYTAFTAGRPEFGVPVLALVAVELYLLATPEARLAYVEAQRN